MKLNKPKFWDERHWLIPILLLPLTFITLIYIFLKKRFINSRRFKINIICIGNLYIGGTGKTPTSIVLANELSKLKKNPVILKKFYKNQLDEQNLIKEKFNSLILSKNRIKGIIEAEEKSFDTVIMDDGFQDYSIKKNFNIICFNQNQRVGNGFVIPSGPLRESLRSLKKVDVILINGDKNIEFENKLLNVNKNLKIFYSSYVPKNINEFRNKRLIALAGIGNPNNFFNLLEKNNLIIEKKLIYPDHYEFTEADIKHITDLSEENNYHIIMTEKDYYKINIPKNKNFKFLETSLEITNKEKLINLILKNYDKNF